MASPYITVSIVEDRKDIRESLHALINSDDACCCISTYENAEDALKAIPELQPDIVLMDIDLPGMNGIDCIKLLKPKCPRVQFMICTVYDEDEKVFDALAAGANSYILKRSSGDKLIEAIKELHGGGSPMSSDIARKIVQHFQVKAKVIEQDYDLTNREKEILNLLAKGITYQQAADTIFISSKTIRKHVYNIYEKLHVHSRMEAVNKYFGNVTK
jgi:two-component system, NarL family, response regulator LiaR